MLPEGVNNCGSPLGTNPPPKDQEVYICVTLQMPPTSKHKIKGQKIHMRFDILTPDQQRDVYVNILNRCYAPLSDVIEYTFEFTKKLELHCHALLICYDKPEHTEYITATIRKRIMQDSRMLVINKANRSRIITNNYIHKCDCPVQWRKYMSKDLDKTPFKLNIISKYIDGSTN